MDLSTRICQAREYAGLSQVALAAACKVSKAAVNQWESGETKKLSAESAILMAKACRVSLDWLVFGKGQMIQKRVVDDRLLLREAINDVLILVEDKGLTTSPTRIADAIILRYKELRENRGISPDLIENIIMLD